MNVPYFPNNLILENSIINIYFDNTSNYNHTNSCIVIEGNREGFISFASMINVYSANIYMSIPLTDFSFVKAEFKIEINEDDNYFQLLGIVSKVANNYIWNISRDGIVRLFSLLHSLGYANNELHLDDDLDESEISVYCVVL